MWASQARSRVLAAGVFSPPPAGDLVSGSLCTALIPVYPTIFALFKN